MFWMRNKENSFPICALIWRPDKVQFNTVKSGWFIVYVLGVAGCYFQKCCIIFLSLKINFVTANSADADEMPCSVAFHLGHCSLQKYPFWGFPSTKG